MDVLTDKAYKNKQRRLYGPNFFRRAEFEQPESRGRIAWPDPPRPGRVQPELLLKYTGQ